MTATVIAEFPALKVIAPLDGKRWKHNDRFALPRETQNHGTLWYTFKLGSIFGYAVENGDDPLTTYERALERGHEIRWASAQPVSITAWERPQDVVFGLGWGDVITFEDQAFRLDPAPNGNVKLSPVATQ